MRSALLVSTLSALLLRCGAAVEPRPGQNVVLVTIDTLRADRVGAYGYEGARTPHLDALAADGVRFEEVLSPVPVTLPSHASLFTGLLPPVHGVRDNTYYRLDEEARTLAEILSQHGYRTAAFVGAFVLDAEFGIAQGFDLYDDDVGAREVDGSPESPRVFAERRGEDVVSAFARWVESEPPPGEPDAPFFAWLHLFDPHLPYAPPPPYPQSYDGEISYADAQVGRALEAVEARGLTDDTLVIVTSDHGESLGEHGEKTHGFFVYDATLRVPLILKSRASLPAGARVPGAVALVDVLPTTLSILDLPAPGGLQGVDRLPSIRNGAAGEAEETYAECYAPRVNFRWAPLVSLRREGYKYIEAPRPELYDLTRDPGETRNLVDEDPQRAGAMRERLARVVESLSEPLSSRHQPDEETIARLRSLGYAGAASTSSEGAGAEGSSPAELPDPKDRLHLWTTLEEALVEQARGRHASVARSAQAVLEEDPGNLLALELLADARYRLGALDDAIAVYDRLLALDDSRPIDHLRHGNLLRRAGRPEDAEKRFREAVELDPDYAEAHERLGELLLSRGRFADARSSFERALDSRQTVGARLGLVRSLRAANDHAGARDELEAMRRLWPGDPSVLSEYAATLAQSGEIERALDLLENAPDHHDVHYTRSVVLRAAGRLEESLEALDEALAERPGSAAALHDRGVLLSRFGRSDEGVAALRNALAQRETADTHNALGTALCRMERCAQGLVHFEHAVRLAPEFLEALENLAQAYAIAGRGEEAERTRRRADQLRVRR